MRCLSYCTTSGRIQYPLTTLQFAIRPSIRANSKFKRDDVIKTVARVVGPGHSVDLKNYDLLILVEVAQVGVLPPDDPLMCCFPANRQSERDWNECCWKRLRQTEKV